MEDSIVSVVSITFSFLYLSNDVTFKEINFLLFLFQLLYYSGNSATLATASEQLDVVARSSACSYRLLACL